MSGDYSRQRFDPQRDFSGVLMQQGRVQLDADWNEQVEILDRRWRAETLDVVGRCGVPRATPNGFQIDVDNNGQLTIGRGRIYVDGLLAENHGGGTQEFDAVLAECRGSADRFAFGRQPFVPHPAPLPKKGMYLIYIDVTQREVTFLEAPDLVEKAVAVDTTTRLQTAWQVKLLELKDGPVTCGTPDEKIPGWLDVIQPSAGRLSNAIVDVPKEQGPCLLAPTVGYRGLENRLYRVEIHHGGSPKKATFKWSRDNASVVAAVTAIPTLDTLTVDETGRDSVLRFNIGNWIEITDDVRSLSVLADGMLPGEMRKIKFVDTKTKTITLDTPLTANFFETAADKIQSRHTCIRRWDQTGVDVVANEGILPVLDDATPVMLEDGIQVSFSTEFKKGEFHVGDYWVFAARTADASIEALENTPARGIHHHFGRLALAQFDGEKWTILSDCRDLFPPRHLALRYVGGDGQEAPPGEKLPCPLTVGVEDEHARPREAVLVRFRDMGLGDILTEVGKPANTGPSIAVPTNADGLAQVDRTLGKKLGCHDVEATLEVPPPQGEALRVRFEAAARQEGEPQQKFPTVVSIKWLASQPFANDQPVPLDVFNRGLAIEFSEPMSPLTLLAPQEFRAPNPNTFIVTLELPQLEQAQGVEIRLGGHRLFIVSGEVKPANNENRVWVFSPRPLIRKEILEEWLKLETQLFDGKFLRCRVVLKSNCILDAAGQRPLDGDAFLHWTGLNGDGNQDRNEFTLDVFGDGRKGGDFESWFWLSQG